MKRVIRHSIDITAARNAAVMKSKDGLFELHEVSGVGINKTPWTGYEVKSLGDAREFVVEIRLIHRSDEQFNGKPVKFEYSGAYVSHGMRMERETLDDTARYIEILQSALEFAREINESDIIKK